MSGSHNIHIFMALVYIIIIAPKNLTQFPGILYKYFKINLLALVILIFSDLC